MTTTVDSNEIEQSLPMGHTAEGHIGVTSIAERLLAGYAELDNDIAEVDRALAVATPMDDKDTLQRLQARTNFLDGVRTVLDKLSGELQSERFGEVVPLMPEFEDPSRGAAADYVNPDQSLDAG
jgi:hypothetical protein